MLDEALKPWRLWFNTFLAPVTDSLKYYEFFRKNKKYKTYFTSYKIDFVNNDELMLKLKESNEKL